MNTSIYYVMILIIKKSTYQEKIESIYLLCFETKLFLKTSTSKISQNHQSPTQSKY